MFVCVNLISLNLHLALNKNLNGIWKLLLYHAYNKTIFVCTRLIVANHFFSFFNAVRSYRLQHSNYDFSFHTSTNQISILHRSIVFALNYQHLDKFSEFYEEPILVIFVLNKITDLNRYVTFKLYFSPDAKIMN